MDLRRDVDPSSDTRDKFTQFQCWKFKYCQNGGGKVCGYDQDAANIAVFEDLCTLYKTNCNMGAKFFQVNIEICDMKTKYQAEYGNVFEWEPIPRLFSTNGPPEKTPKDINSSKNEYNQRNISDETFRTNDSVVKIE